MEKSRWVKLALSALRETVLVAVAAGAIIAAWRLIGHFQEGSATAADTRPSQKLFAVDSKLTIKSVDFTKHPLSLVLVTSPTCPYCLASKAFYQALEAESRQSGVPLYVAVPSRGKATAYLRDTGFSPQSVREWADLNLAARGTPTLVAIDQNSIVQRVWVGQLPPDRESGVFRLIKAGKILDSDSYASNSVHVRNYSSGEIAKLKVPGGVNIIDTHERDFPRIRPDAIVIPIEELFVRAPSELNQKQLQLVDCSSLVAAQCQRSVDTLTKAGFRVATIDAGTYEEYCRAAAVQ